MDPGKEEGETCLRNLLPQPKEPESRQSASIIQVNGKSPAVTCDFLIKQKEKEILNIRNILIRGEEWRVRSMPLAH